MYIYVYMYIRYTLYVMIEFVGYGRGMGNVDSQREIFDILYV